MSTSTQSVSFGQAVGIITSREIDAKLRDRGFLISTVVTLVLIIAAIAAPAILAGRTPQYTVVTAGPAAQRVAADLAQPQGSADAEFTVTATSASDVSAAETAVRNGDADIAIVDATGSSPVEVIAHRQVPGELATAIDAGVADTRLADRLGELGASPPEVAELLAPVTVAQRFLDPDGGQSLEALILGIAFAVVFFFTALTFGLTIAQSVTEEKQNRVVELLVAVMPVRALLVGKVLGNLVMALGQIVLLLAVGLLAASVAGAGDLIPLLTGSAGWFVAFFVFGFAMLACLWAAAGALASRVEDLGSTTLPVQLLIMAPFFAGVSLTEESPARVALSYVPFSAPLIMPQRLVSGDADWWEGLLGLGVIAVTGALLVVVAERLYRGSLLRTRGKASIREAWAAAGS